MEGGVSGFCKCLSEERMRAMGDGGISGFFLVEEEKENEDERRGGCESREERVGMGRN